MLTVLCSAKGSPGTTSSALALAAAWPHQVTLVEADESGSSLAIRARTENDKALRETPTVATLAAAARSHDVDPHLVMHHGQDLNNQVHIVPGVATQESGSGMVALWDGLANALAASETDVLVDVGRIHSASLAMSLVQAADAVVVVCRADAESIVHLRTRMQHLQGVLGRGRRRPAPIAPLVVSTPRNASRDADDIDQILTVAGLKISDCLHLAWDPKALEQLEQGSAPSGRGLARTSLVRSAQAASDQLLAMRSLGPSEELLS